MPSINYNTYDLVNEFDPYLPLSGVRQAFTSTDKVYFWLELSNFESSGGQVVFEWIKDGTVMFTEYFIVGAGSWSWWRFVSWQNNLAAGNWEIRFTKIDGTDEISNIMRQSFTPYKFLVQAAAAPIDTPIGIFPDPTIQPEPTPVTTPIVSPSPIPTAPKLYEILITTKINPELPVFIVEKVRTLMFKGGWALSNMYPTTDGYIMQVEEVGSVTISLTMILVIGVLALIGVGAITWNIRRISDNNTQVEKFQSVSSTINGVIDYCNQAGISSAECQELIENVKLTYAEVTPEPKDGNPLGDLFKNNSIGIIALGAAIVALTKK